jgi:hypothetical protein
MNLPIPEAALDKHIAFLGGTGSGKTSGAKSGVVERTLDAGERVIVIDPTSAWWRLRLGKDGKGKGFPIYIFGGEHGDYPLRVRDAEVLAEAFATSSDSAIFDTSLMTVGERVAFFTQLFGGPARCDRNEAKWALEQFGLDGAEEDNHVPGGVVRNYWRTVATGLIGLECECKAEEPAISEDKGDFVWRAAP